MKERVALDSSAISAVSYDHNRRTLDVQFQDGEPYRYFAVPEAEFRALLAAESAGSYWNSVKHKYRYEKLK